MTVNIEFDGGCRSRAGKSRVPAGSCPPPPPRNRREPHNCSTAARSRRHAAAAYTGRTTTERHRLGDGGGINGTSQSRTPVQDETGTQVSWGATSRFVRPVEGASDDVPRRLPRRNLRSSESMQLILITFHYTLPRPWPTRLTERPDGRATGRTPEATGDRNERHACRTTQTRSARRTSPESRWSGCAKLLRIPVVRRALALGGHRPLESSCGGGSADHRRGVKTICGACRPTKNPATRCELFAFG